MERNQEMSSFARQRMATMLPDLLGAVRSRRRRRVAARATVATTVAAALLAVLVTLWPKGGDRGAVPSPNGPQHHIAAVPFTCEVVRDIPGVVARYRVATPKHKDWFVGDAELQNFLRNAERPDGIVRVSGKVVVASSALDPFPEVAPFPEIGEE